MFTVEDVIVNEGDATATLTISSSNPIDIPVDVNVAYADVSTLVGDFDHASGSATFAALFDCDSAGHRRITDDNVVEAVESFGVALSSSTAFGGRSIDTTDDAVVSITDNDTAVFTIEDVSAGEDDEIALLTVSVSKPDRHSDRYRGVLRPMEIQSRVTSIMARM